MGVACGMKLRNTIHLPSGGHTIVRHGECASHNHSLDDLDATKKPEALRHMAGSEMAQGYTAPAITQTLHASHRPEVEKVWLNTGGKFFSCKDVHNSGSKWKIKNPDLRFIGAKASWQEQRAEAESWLRSQEIKVISLDATYHKDNSLTPGLLFADPERFKVLRQRGHLSLMDATHETNWHGWLLYTVVVRDE
jgi:hypothetical protein